MTGITDAKDTAGIAVRFDNVSIVFGDQPERALPLMDAGQSRAEIQAATGQVLGCMIAPLRWPRERSLC